MEMMRIMWTSFVLSSVYSLPVIQISTCDAPVASLSLSICCFMENLPARAAVIFSKNSNQVAGISQSCDLWYPYQNEAINFTSSCSMRGNISVYSIVFPGQNFSSDDGHNTWSCGFYGSTAEMKITVLDSHRYIKQSPGSTAMLQYILADTASPAGSIRVSSLQQNLTILEVDIDNKVIFKEDRIYYVGNITQKNISLLIQNLSADDNGTYICKYTIDIETIPNILLQGITILVTGKPPQPTVNNVNDGNKVTGVISGKLACTANSGYASPLFYIPQLETSWIFPSLDTMQPGTTGYNLLTNGSTAYITGVDCTKKTLPVYCFVENDVGRSEVSEEFYPHTMC